jgi:hypothetical protein
MTRSFPVVLLLCLLTILAPIADAATLKLQATAPGQDNGGTCAAPILIAGQGVARTVHFSWTGPEAGEDSVVTSVNLQVILLKQVKAGSYTVRAWATKPSIAEAGCDTTAVFVAQAPPWKVRF